MALREVLGRRLAVDPGESDAAHLKGEILVARDEPGAGALPVALEEPGGAGAVGVGVGGLVDRLEDQMGEKEGKVEDRIADMSNLEVNDPEVVFSHKDVLRREVAVYKAPTGRRDEGFDG